MRTKIPYLVQELCMIRKVFASKILLMGVKKIQETQVKSMAELKRDQRKDHLMSLSQVKSIAELQ